MVSTTSSRARRSPCPTPSRERSPQTAGLKWPISFTRKSGVVPFAPRTGSDVLATITAALAESGLALRGGFVFDPAENARWQSVLLVGNVGAGYWQHFTKWRASQPSDLSDPLDRWSRLIIENVAEQVGARVVMPNDRPFAPFQQWAMRAEGLRPSPLGILIHPEFGLWHAYRGSLLFEGEISIQASEKQIHPCDLCLGKPCINACPVSALSGDGFAHERCRSFLRSPAGDDCMHGGCRARNACPVGRAFAYPAEMQAFHQQAFVGA